ncbi:hypothetical protein RYA05_02945 [Pseudomonas syringae pv. actinidiae]|nr:hypothetical protein [Pseudomonas syringae pv. actinidiae]
MSYKMKHSSAYGQVALGAVSYFPFLCILVAMLAFSAMVTLLDTMILSSVSNLSATQKLVMGITGVRLPFAFANLLLASVVVLVLSLNVGHRRAKAESKSRAIKLLSVFVVVSLATLLQLNK